MTDHVRDLVLVVKEINVRHGKMKEITKQLNGDPKFVALRGQLEGHKIARNLNIEEAYERVCLNQELGPDMWYVWVEENLDLTVRQVSKIVHKKDVSPELYGKVPVGQESSVQSDSTEVDLFDDDEEADRWIDTPKEADPAEVLMGQVKKAELSTEHLVRFANLFTAYLRSLGLVKGGY